MSDNQPNKAQRTIDSLKLLQDWSKWLIALETIVCMSLWTRLTSGPFGFDVFGLADVLGVDYHRGDPIAFDFVFCAASR
jgi:hypothetical protein